MKKQHIFIIAIFAVMAVAYFGVSTVEKRTEDSLRQAFIAGFKQTAPNETITVGDVKYSMFNKSISLSNIEVPANPSNPNNPTFKIENINLELNKTFSDSFVIEDLKSVRVTGLSATNTATSLKLKEFFLAKPQLNLAVAMPAFQQMIVAKSQENIVGIIEQIEILSENFSYENLLFAGFEFSEGKDIAKLERFEFKNVKNNIAESFTIKNFFFSITTGDSFNVESIETTNMPVIAGFRYLSNVDNFLVDGSQKFDFKNVSLTKGNDKLLSIANINFDSNIKDKKITGTANIKDATIHNATDKMMLPPPVQAIFTENKLKDAVFNLTLETELDFVKNTMNVKNYKINMNELVGVTTEYQINSTDLKQYYKDYFTGLTDFIRVALDNDKDNNGNMLAILQKLSDGDNLSLVSASFTFDVKTQVREMLIKAAKALNPSLTDEAIATQQKMMEEQVAQGLASFNLTGLKDPINSFIANFGQITFKINPKEPIPFTVFQTPPTPETISSLNLTATHQAN
ncbi:hypothetical protein [Desulfovibrio litoralis]|uniref:DUF945 domain-containing protein n=1 Tax=Desulfovibrio litoralis DSM 11393 TaxID=1121455 RepID=A0A1M7T954_9BACT|nr:hypothetical protein [Desulfovibrio litoralis]SHN67222.1 hypothetical protein SAMN02745728_01749 [Desulfovibrio litoralis DSM 11393]